MGVYSKAPSTAYKRLVEGKRERFGLCERAHVRFIFLTGLPRHWNNSVQVKWKVVCLFVKGKFCMLNIVWKHSSSLHYSVFMNGTFPSNRAEDSKSLTSLEHDKSVIHISVGKAILFFLPVSDFVSFALKAPLVYLTAFFPKGIQQSSFSSLSTRTKHNELWQRWPTSRSVLANVHITAKYWLSPSNGSGPLSLVH